MSDKQFGEEITPKGLQVINLWSSVLRAVDTPGSHAGPPYYRHAARVHAQLAVNTVGVYVGLAVIGVCRASCQHGRAGVKGHLGSIRPELGATYKGCWFA